MFSAILLGSFFAFAVAVGESSTGEEREQLKAERAAAREEAKEAREEAREEAKEAREEAKEERKEKRCERIQNRIQNREERYEEKLNRHEMKFDRVADKVESLSERFKDSGLDVSDLEASLATFEGMVNDLRDEQEAFIAALGETENYVCGESEGEFKNQLKEAREMVPGIKEQVAEVRDYYKNTLREEILKLREQIKELREDNNEESDNE